MIQNPTSCYRDTLRLSPVTRNGRCHAMTAAACGMSNATEDLGGTVSQPTRTRNVEDGKLIVIQYAW